MLRYAALRSEVVPHQRTAALSLPPQQVFAAALEQQSQPVMMAHGSSLAAFGGCPPPPPSSPSRCQPLPLSPGKVPSSAAPDEGQALTNRRAMFADDEDLVPPPPATPAEPTPRRSEVASAETQTAERGGREPFEERLASLELGRVKAEREEDERLWQAERDSWQAEREIGPSQAQVDEVRAALLAEQEASAALRADLEQSRQLAADRTEELSAAMAALGEARAQLAKRASDASHWRAESARAVARLEVLTDAFERQSARLAKYDLEAALWRDE